MEKKKIIKQKKVTKTETTYQEAVNRAGPPPDGGPDLSWKDYKNKKGKF